MLNGFGALGRRGRSFLCGPVKRRPPTSVESRTWLRGAYWSPKQQNVAFQTSRQTLTHACPTSACRAPPCRAPPAAPRLATWPFSPFPDVLPCGSSACSLRESPSPTHPPSSKVGSPPSLTSCRHQTGWPSGLTSRAHGRHRGVLTAPKRICRYCSRERDHPAPPFPSTLCFSVLPSRVLTARSPGNLLRPALRTRVPPLGPREDPAVRSPAGWAPSAPRGVGVAQTLRPPPCLTLGDASGSTASVSCLLRHSLGPRALLPIPAAPASAPTSRARVRISSRLTGRSGPPNRLPLLRSWSSNPSPRIHGFRGEPREVQFPCHSLLLVFQRLPVTCGTEFLTMTVGSGFIWPLPPLHTMCLRWQVSHLGVPPRTPGATCVCLCACFPTAARSDIFQLILTLTCHVTVSQLLWAAPSPCVPTAPTD